jgi:hypothetical protein
MKRVLFLVSALLTSQVYAGESRIYAQLSKQIADSLFGEDSGLADTDWVENTTPFGDTIKWKRESDIVYVEIYDSNGTLASEFQTPVGEFAF